MVMICVLTYDIFVMYVQWVYHEPRRLMPSLMTLLRHATIYITEDSELRGEYKPRVNFILATYWFMIFETAGSQPKTRPTDKFNNSIDKLNITFDGASQVTVKVI